MGMQNIERQQVCACGTRHVSTIPTCAECFARLHRAFWAAMGIPPVTIGNTEGKQ
jgi:hypothetical protein